MYCILSRTELTRLVMGTIFLVYIQSTEARPPPPPNHPGLDFHIIIRVSVLVICDRNSIARKREEFPILVAEVAYSRLHFASRASLLQLLQKLSCTMPAASVELSITLTKIQVYLVRPDNTPCSTHKCLNIYYPSYSILHIILTIVFPDTRTEEYQPIFHGVT